MPHWPAVATPAGGRTTPLPPRTQDLSPIRAALEKAGYTDAGLRTALGTREPNLGLADTRAECLWATRQRTPLNTLIRLFLLGETVGCGDAGCAVEPTDLRDWEAAGLIEADGDRVVARARLSPYRELMIASDRTVWPLEQSPADYVMGVGSSSLTLANVTVRRTGAAALDLGCGCGIQALLAAGHSESVVATDLNPRAVGFARLNAALNGLGNTECLQGSFFEPVSGRAFDLVVSNPPFVISPESTYIYRDSGLAADQACRSIVQDAPRHLREGGFCHILCNWAHVRGEDWRERLAAWFEGSSCDAWVMRCETHEPSAYASTWIRHTERGRAAIDPAQYDAWMCYYERAGIEAISAGVVSMRRSDRRAHWFRADDAPGGMVGPCGDYVALGFGLYDFLTSTGRDERSLLQQTLRLSDDVRLHTEFAPSAEGWAVTAARLRFERGLVYTHETGTDMAGLVARFRQPRRVSEVLEDAGLAGGDVSQCLAALRELVARGFLVPESA